MNKRKNKENKFEKTYKNNLLILNIFSFFLLFLISIFFSLFFFSFFLRTKHLNDYPKKKKYEKDIISKNYSQTNSKKKI